jgi:hypothetical protein
MSTGRQWSRHELVHGRQSIAASASSKLAKRSTPRGATARVPRNALSVRWSTARGFPRRFGDRLTLLLRSDQAPIRDCPYPPVRLKPDIPVLTRCESRDESSSDAQDPSQADAPLPSNCSVHYTVMHGAKERSLHVAGVALDEGQPRGRGAQHQSKCRPAVGRNRG